MTASHARTQMSVPRRCCAELGCSGGSGTGTRSFDDIADSRAGGTSSGPMSATTGPDVEEAMSGVGCDRWMSADTIPR